MCHYKRNLKIVSQVNLAINLFRSKKQKTVILEGDTDVRMLSPILSDDKLRFVHVGNKTNVTEAVSFFDNQQQAREGVFFIVDIDYDHICNNIKEHDNLMYFFYCMDTKKAFFNDVESFLINTVALRKVIENLIPNNEIKFGELLSSLEESSRLIGSIRAANSLLSIDKKVTILDGLELFEFVEFDCSNSYCNIKINEDLLKERLNSSSPRKLEIEELFSKSHELLEYYKDKPWALSRGHDITKILEQYLEKNTKKYILKEDKSGKKYTYDLEALLRMAMNTDDFLETYVGKKLISIKAIS